MTELEALQATLEAEHAAVYLYGLLGARTSQSAEAPLYEALRAAYDAHRDRRDELIAAVAAAGGPPVQAAPAYDAPEGLEPLEARTMAALDLERGCARVYAALVGSAAGPQRVAGLGYLNDAAARELSFRGTPEIFPGADELADR